MKIFLGVCLVFVMVYQSECFTLDHNVTIGEVCLDEAGVSEEVVTNYKDGDEASEDLNCYFHCVFTMFGYIDEEGVIQVERFKGDKNVEDLDVECLKKAPKLLECNDINILMKCKK